MVTDHSPRSTLTHGKTFVRDEVEDENSVVVPQLPAKCFRREQDRIPKSTATKKQVAEKPRNEDRNKEKYRLEGENKFDHKKSVELHTRCKKKSLLEEKVSCK